MALKQAITITLVTILIVARPTLGVVNRLGVVVVGCLLESSCSTSVDSWILSFFKAFSYSHVLLLFHIVFFFSCSLCDWSLISLFLSLSHVLIRQLPSPISTSLFCCRLSSLNKCVDPLFFSVLFVFPSRCSQKD